jgi:membrane protein
MATSTWGKTHHRARARARQHEKIHNVRGREAESPKEIPPVGWKDTLLRVKDGIREDRVSLVSAGMAFFALLASVPALTATVFMYAWFSDPADIAGHLAQFENVLPGEIMEMIHTQLASLAGQTPGALGFGAIFSLVFALVSASKSTRSFMEAMNIIYNEREERHFVRFFALAIGLTLLAIILVLIAMAVVVVLPAVFAFIDLGGGTQMAINILSWLILIALFSFFMAIAFRFGPDRKVPKWKWVSVGAVTSSVLWVVASLGFTFYVARFGNFNATYGSLGAVVVLMLWFYITSFVLLLGAEINAELEHQTNRDSTIGEDKPMGSRGAQMADTEAEVPKFKSSRSKKKTKLA